MSKPKARIAPIKRQRVQELVKKLKTYNVIGVVNLEGLPAMQLQRIKAQLRDKFELFMTRKTLITRALEAAKDTKPTITELIPHLQGVPALLLTNDNPFSIYKIIKKNKSPAAAKAGQIAPMDIIIPAGPTPFAPGPVISEFAQLGIKAGVEGGKVAVKEPKVVVKEGQVIDDKVASMLARLSIQPMEIGINVNYILEGDLLYTRKVLDIDEKEFLAQLHTAAAEGFNLAIEAAYPARETTEPLIQKASREARTLALECNILTAEIIEELLAKAAREGESLKQAAKPQN